jgi:cysteinyl-tRNA synthetase
MGWLSRILPNRNRVAARPQIFLTNTLTGNKEVFVSIKPGAVLMYSCGPTVYAPAHIGNLRAYVFSDTLARTLRASGYDVRQVINITDFGHLVTDGDGGEDKMTKGLKREKFALTLPNMRLLSERYAKTFIEDLGELNIDTLAIDFPRASDYISEQIAFIKTLLQKGYAYETKSGVYFDTTHFPTYGKLGGIDLAHQQEGERVAGSKDKRHPADFVLWKPDKKLGWESPWSLGFPGWHIECSAMSRALLGQELDIHTGGNDLIAIHHNNEIAQSEAASGRTFVRYWLHNAFLTMDGEKASKSLGNVVYLSEVIEKGFHPLAVRYLFLQAHYRTQLSFSWDSLAGAAEALHRLWRIAREVRHDSDASSESSDMRIRFAAMMRDDLSSPQALGVLWDALKSDEYTPEEKWGLLEDADDYLGLMLRTPPVPATLSVSDLPEGVQKLLQAREEARQSKDYAKADSLRGEIIHSGYLVEDGPNGPVLTKKVG